MQFRIKQLILPLGIVALAASGSSVAESASERATDGNTEFRWVVDHSGRPPFQRERVEVEVVDVAAMEAVETEIVRQRSTRGKPPFKRRWVEVPVVDTASLELLDVDEKKTTFRGRPPFRRN